LISFSNIAAVDAAGRKLAGFWFYFMFLGQ